MEGWSSVTVHFQLQCHPPANFPQGETALQMAQFTICAAYNVPLLKQEKNNKLNSLSSGTCHTLYLWETPHLHYNRNILVESKEVG